MLNDLQIKLGEISTFSNRLGSFIVTYDATFPATATNKFLDATTQLLESNDTIDIDGHVGQVVSIQVDNGMINYCL